MLEIEGHGSVWDVLEPLKSSLNKSQCSNHLMKATQVQNLVTVVRVKCYHMLQH